MKRLIVTATGVVLIVSVVAGIAVAQQAPANRYDKGREFHAATAQAAADAHTGANRPETAKADADAKAARDRAGLGGKGPLSVGNDDAYASPTIRDGHFGVEVTVSTDPSPKGFGI